MNVNKGLVTTIGIAALMVIGVACGNGEAPPSADAPPATSPTHTPTMAKKDAEKSAEPRVECEVTLELALENPMLVARGVDPIPSRVDAVNSARCRFETPISTVTLELHRDGNKVFAQEVALDPAVADVGFPLTAEEGDAIPADLELGSYDRLIKVTSVDGAVKEVRSDPDSVWLLDPISSPKAEARLALIAARRALVDSLAIPYAGPALITFEPVEWPDAGLGCPKPGMMYAQVVTPGFRLLFEYEGQQHEYHTDRDGSMMVACDEPDGVATRPRVGSPDGSESSDYGLQSLIDDLVSAGATVEELTGPLSRHGFSVGGRRVAVNREAIHVYEFQDETTARKEAGYVSPDGGTISVPLEGGVTRETHNDYIATPHFYYTDRVIVVYIGDDREVIGTLQNVLGPQFAGGTVPDPQPLMGSIVPNLRLTFEGVEYTGVEILGVASPTGPIVCCGTPVNMDDMEVVGTGIQHNPDGDVGVQVYRPKAGGTTDVYTFTPAQTFQVSGEPGETDTTPATWIRWAAK